MIPSIVLVECPRPAGRRRSCRAVSSAQFVASLRSGAVPVVAVLGDGALGSLDPGDLRASIRGTRTRVLATPVNAPLETIVRWARSHVADLQPWGRLVERLREVEARPVRPWLEPSDWVGVPVPGTSAEAAAVCLASLDAPRVERWAESLVVSRHELRRDVMRWFGSSPREICRRYVRAQLRAGRAHGLRTAAIAESLGYSDASSLLRAARAATSS